MGKGDKKTKKGKIFKDSYGNSRSKKLIKAKLKRTASKKPVATVADAAAKPKRAAAKKKKRNQNEDYFKHGLVVAQIKF